jgi:hypothetical protein
MQYNSYVLIPLRSIKLDPTRSFSPIASLLVVKGHLRIMKVSQLFNVLAI